MAEIVGWEAPLGDRAAWSPHDFFQALKDEGRHADAAFFLGQALPRHETVAWAARAVRDLRAAEAEPRPAGDRDALKAALLWVSDPSETRRRAAWTAAEAATPDGAERLTALAVFFSGGSIAPLDCEPVLAPREAAGGMAATAVFLATQGATDKAAAMDMALALGEGIADHGVAGPPRPAAGGAA